MQAIPSLLAERPNVPSRCWLGSQALMRWRVRGGRLPDGSGGPQAYSAMLPDEVEKANPYVSKVLLQVFDDVSMKAGLGRTVDFKNTVVVFDLYSWIADDPANGEGRLPGNRR